MSDFFSFNEFVERTASAKVEHHRETMAKALRRSTGADAGFLRAAAVDVSDDTIEAEFVKMKNYVLDMYKDVTDVRYQHTFLGPGGNFHDCIPFEQQPTYRAAGKAGFDPSGKPPAPIAAAGPTHANPDAFGPLVEPILPPLKRGLVDPFGNPLACPEGMRGLCGASPIAPDGATLTGSRICAVNIHCHGHPLPAPWERAKSTTTPFAMRQAAAITSLVRRG